MHDESDDESVRRRRYALPYLFEKELIDKANRHIHVMDKYVPKMRVVPLTPKFYARHDQNHLPKNHFGERCLFLAQYKYEFQPKDKYELPFLESHNYGWITEPRNLYNNRDSKVSFHAKKRTDLTIFGEKINSEKVTQRPAFTGVKFYLR